MDKSVLFGITFCLCYCLANTSPALKGRHIGCRKGATNMDMVNIGYGCPLKDRICWQHCHEAGYLAGGFCFKIACICIVDFSSLDKIKQHGRELEERLKDLNLLD